MPSRRQNWFEGWRLFAVLAVSGLLVAGPAVPAGAAGNAPGAPGVGASWTTGAKIAVGTATTAASPLWFTAANGITSEVFYPRLDIPQVQDLQYVVTDGATFTDLERDATTHAVNGAPS